MNFEELKQEISKSHVDYKSVDENLSNFLEFKEVENGRGVYAISVDLNKIHNKKVIQCIEKNSTQKNVIYIGTVKKKGNIFNRCNQEINNTGHATFFRKIGSVLGYKSMSHDSQIKKNNFRFEASDKQEIKKWNHKNLRLKIFNTLCSNEKALIQYFKPPFNEINNRDFTCEEINNLRNKNKGGGNI